MKTLFKKILLTLAIIFSVAGATSLISPAPTYAAEDEMTFSCRNFLGLTSWDCGLGEINDQTDLEDGIVVILANILTDLSVIAAYLVLGFVIYGGYLYIFSSGDPAKIQNSKKTLTRAFIGLAIVTLANVILNAARFAFLGDKTFTDCSNLTEQGACYTMDGATAIITTTLQWFIGTAGVVALIFVVVGGIGYVTSAGDPGKLQKAKNTIIYALIGLIIVAIAELLVSFVSGIINDANPATSFINQTIITKELE